MSGATSSRIAVIIPAYGEARLIGRTLRGIPGDVSAIYVVDDASPDATADEAAGVPDPRIQVLRHERNRGVGAAIVTGYQAALEAGHELLVVMAADDQMDPRDLPALLAPAREGLGDYVKGNRFLHPERRTMPFTRRLGGTLLATLTRMTTGLRVDDTQCGYTVLTAAAARKLPLERLWPRYGYPNHLLQLLAEAQLRVIEVPVRPVYADEESGVRWWHLLTVGWLVIRGQWTR